MSNRTSLSAAIVGLALASASAAAQVISRKPTIQIPPPASESAGPLPTAACPLPRDTTYDARIILPSIPRTARSAIVTICLGAGRRLPGVTSFEGTITFPPSLAVYDTATSPPAIPGSIDAVSPGVVHFSATIPVAMPSGPILALRVRLLRAGSLPPFGLDFGKMTTVKRASALDHLWIQGRPPVRAQARRPGSGARVSRPMVDSTPRIASLDRQTIPASRLASGEVVTITLLGAYFDRTANTVTFGPLSIPNVPSATGSSIKLVVPTHQATASGAITALPPSLYTIRVTTSHGTSNAVQFRIMP